MDIKLQEKLYIKNQGQDRGNGEQTKAATLNGSGRINAENMDPWGDLQKKGVLLRSSSAIEKAVPGLSQNNYGKNARNYTITGDAGFNNKNTAKGTRDNIPFLYSEAINKLEELVSTDDYEKLKEWGLAPEDDDPGSLVTVYERIQVELAAYCDDYDISAMNINQEKMGKILGSKTMAAALSMASDIHVSDDGTKEYLLANSLKPTIKNVYLANHSQTSALNSNNITEKQWENLKPQVETFLETNGFEINSENLNSSRWIISKNLPLNVENLSELNSLNNVNMDEFKSNMEKMIIKTIALGMEGTDTDITGKTFDKAALNEAVNTVNEAMDEDVDYILRNNKTLNIENLKLQIARREKEYENNLRQSSAYDTGAGFIQSSHILNEARMYLTSVSLFNMRKVGISIEYTEITKLTDMARKDSEILMDALTTSKENREYIHPDRQTENYEKNMSVLKSTLNVMGGFYRLPVETAGKVYGKETEFTAGSVYREGMLIKAKMDKAFISYETIGTKVRKDLGDSIDKAFRNTDEILDGIGMENSEENRRAVRVLGYNSMDITKEAVNGVNSVLFQLDTLVKNMTPATVVYLVSNGINPLNTEIPKLNNILENINRKNNLKNEDKYSSFLWKLEKNGDIKPEEREAYIGIYRIINAIEKKDGQAAVAALNMKSEFNLSNIYTAYKTTQGKGIDRKIDEAFGMLSESCSQDQLVKYFENYQQIADNAMEENQYQYEKIKEKLAYINQAEKISEGEFSKIISDMGQPGINELYSRMLAKDRKFHERIKDRMSEISHWWQEPDEDISELDRLYDSVTFDETEKEDMSTYKEVSALETMNAGLMYIKNSSREHSYYVPVEIDNNVSLLHITLKRDEKNDGRGKITIYSENKEYGVSAFLYKKDNEITGIIATDSRQAEDSLRNMELNMEIIYASHISDSMWDGKVPENGDDMSYNQLVELAKLFIGNVLRKM